MINILLYGGISLIIIGLILYCVSCYMVRYYEKKLLENKLHKSFMKEKQNGKNNFNYKHTIIK